jgi:hypothetical protein
MDTNGIPVRLRPVTDTTDRPQDGEARPVTDRRREDYWSQVQALRADLASLRHAN